MRLVIQRVSAAHVKVSGTKVGEIGPGLLVFAGISKPDREQDADYLAAKLTNLRIFPDEAGKMNRSLVDIGGSALVISQFTLYASTARGRRPSFELAADPDLARRIYDYFVGAVRRQKVPVQTGIFQAEMSVSLSNEGPVTLILDSKAE